MWGLQVVATDWRANSEVLAGATDVVIHPHEPDLEDEIELALRAVGRALRQDEVSTFSTANRAAFERKYLAKDGRSPVADAAVELARSPRRRIGKQGRAGAPNGNG